MGIYHNISTVKNIILNTNLNLTIVRYLPSEFNIIYSDKLGDHTSQNPMNLEPLSIFYFNARFVAKMESGFKANPVDFDHALPPVNVNVNAVHYRNPHPTKPYHSKPTPSQSNRPSLHGRVSQPSSKLSSRTPKLTIVESEQTPKKTQLCSRLRSLQFFRKVDFLSKNGIAPVRTEPANTWV